MTEKYARNNIVGSCTVDLERLNVRMISHFESFNFDPSVDE